MLSFDDLKYKYGYGTVKVGKSQCLTLPKADFPRSITRHEFEWLREKSKNYNTALEIATGTGVSSIAISESIPVITIDCYIEEFSGNCDNYTNNYEDKPDCGENSIGYKVLNKIISDNKLRIEQNIGFSPNDVSFIMKKRIVDFVFIDALHTNEALLKDIGAIIPFLNKRFFIAIHDLHCFSDNCLSEIEGMLGEIKRVDRLRYGELGFNMGYING